MAEDPNTPIDPKARKGRSFASFLLFLTILVAILAYVGGQELTAPKKLSQDQYLYNLYTGQIERQEFRGNLITGSVADGTPDGRTPPVEAAEDGPTHHSENPNVEAGPRSA